MNKITRFLQVTVPALVLLGAGCFADVNAPGALPQCIVEYSQTQNFNTETRVVLYKADSTFVELSVTSDGIDASHPQSSSAPHSGSYAYTVDPQNHSHAIITYSNVTGGLAKDDLYFETATDGRLTVGQVTVPENSSRFTINPFHTNDSGGIAFSTRCALSAGGSVTSGIAIAPGGPRWVLFRAVGASLANYGVTGGVTHPSFTLYNSNQAVVGNSSVWSSDSNLVSGYRSVFSLVGDFPLAEGSDEAVMLVSLQPGTYTAVFKADGAGQILCEAYTLPY